MFFLPAGADAPTMFCLPSLFALAGPLLICPGSIPPEHALCDLVVFKVAYSAYDPQVASAVRSVASGCCYVFLTPILLLFFLMSSLFYNKNYLTLFFSCVIM